MQTVLWRPSGNWNQWPRKLLARHLNAKVNIQCSYFSQIWTEIFVTLHSCNWPTLWYSAHDCTSSGIISHQDVVQFWRESSNTHIHTHIFYPESLCDQAVNKHVISISTAWPNASVSRVITLFSQCLLQMISFIIIPPLRAVKVQEDRHACTWLTAWVVLDGAPLTELHPSWWRANVQVQTPAAYPSFVCLFIHMMLMYRGEVVLCAAGAIDPRPLPACVWTPAEPFQGLMMSIFHWDLTGIKPPCCVCSHVCVMMCGLSRLRPGAPQRGSIPAGCIGDPWALFFCGEARRPLTLYRFWGCRRH